MTDNLRLWFEIGRLQGQNEVLEERLTKLEREYGPIIDNPPQPTRRKGKNVVPFPNKGRRP